MPNMSEAEETICKMLHEAWQDITPIDWPNVERSEPHLSEGEGPWAMLEIQHDGSDQVTLAEQGRRTFERRGGLTVKIFVPAGKRGLSDASTLAMVAANAFEGKTSEGVRFYRVGARTVGREGSWFQINVTADFEFDEIR